MGFHAFFIIGGLWMTVSADLWDRCLENLKKDLNRQSFETWFKPTKASVAENNTLKVQVPNEFFRDWIRDHYQPQIQKALKTLHPEQLEIQFEIDASVPSKPKQPFGHHQPIPPRPRVSVEVVEKPRLTMPTPTKVLRAIRNSSLIPNLISKVSSWEIATVSPMRPA